jgi:hypothetical protein
MESPKSTIGWFESYLKEPRATFHRIQYINTSLFHPFERKAPKKEPLQGRKFGGKKNSRLRTN